MTYKIIRSDRKTLSIAVSIDNKITVRCPKNMPVGRVESFVAAKQKWIEKVIKSNTEKLADNFKVIEYKEIFVYGSRLPLVISDTNRITENAVYIKNLTNIKALFVKHFSDSFVHFARQVSIGVKMPANRIIIRSYKRRWGCCDKTGNLSFNWLLLMLPRELQLYVIVHELCHTKFFDHSKKFWQLVEKYQQNYKLLRKRLKNYAFLIGLY